VRRDLIKTLVLIIVYVLLGSARSIQENPFIPGAIIAVNMFIPVLAGILFGKYKGLMVGFFGTLANALITNNPFEYAAIIPHTIMGFMAGYLNKKIVFGQAPLSLLIGHILNIVAFMIIGLMVSINPQLLLGVAYEIFIGSLAVLIISNLYCLKIEKHGTKH